MSKIRRPTRTEKRFCAEQIRHGATADERLRWQCLQAWWHGVAPREIARTLGVGLSRVYRVRQRYQQFGILGVCDGRSRQGPRKVTPRYLRVLVGLLDQRPDPDRLGRSGWTLSLLVRELERLTGIALHVSWLWQLVRRLDFRRKRTRPSVWSCNPKRRFQWARLVRTLWKVQPGEVILFGDEVDIHLNPKLGYIWCRRGQPASIETPGRNQKRHLAGALNVDTGKFLAVENRTKRSALFVDLLRKVARAYRGARKIHLIVDNYKIHDSRETRQALEELRGRVKLHFLPPYSPEYNPTELVWQQLHDAVTRNHPHRTMDRLLRAVWRYLVEADRFFFESPLPFRATRHGLVFSEPK